MVDQILSDLDVAIANLPESTNDPGRATKGAALGMKASVLLYNEKWIEAADAAKQVMDLGLYSLFEDYRALFMPGNENNPEVIFDVQLNHLNYSMIGMC